MRILAAVLLAAMAMPAAGHEITLADGRTVDYRGLKVDGRSCCGSQDCRVTTSRWTSDGALWVETAPGIWVQVPPDRIILILPPALWEAADVTHACWAGPPQDPTFYCVFPEGTNS